MVRTQEGVLKCTHMYMHMYMCTATLRSAYTYTYTYENYVTHCVELYVYVGVYVEVQKNRGIFDSCD